MKNKAVFLDRDGVINKVIYHDEKGVYSATDVDELVILPRVDEALKFLKKLNYKTIIVSNQPGVAFGYIKKRNLEEINRKLFKLLKVDAIYNCVHHPDFTGECRCRKPKAGSFLKAIRDFNIDVKKSYVVGDNIKDIKVDLPFKKRFLIGTRSNMLFNLLHEEKISPEIVKDLYVAVLKIRRDNKNGNIC